jgi:hypothetical protein
MVQARKPTYTAQDHGEQKVTGFMALGMRFPALEVDGGADEFAELQFLKHGRDGSQSTVCGQVLPRETVLLSRH